MLWCLCCAVQLLIEQLDAHLIVFSPYLSLSQLLQSDASLADLSQNAWAALNDSYRTDVALVYPPHLLAVAAVYLASVICSRDLQTWMQELAVDMNHVSSRGGDVRHTVFCGCVQWAVGMPLQRWDPWSKCMGRPNLLQQHHAAATERNARRLSAAAGGP